MVSVADVVVSSVDAAAVVIFVAIAVVDYVKSPMYMLNRLVLIYSSINIIDLFRRHKSQQQQIIHKNLMILFVDNQKTISMIRLNISYNSKFFFYNQ